jgi:hypothetical protein
MTTSLTTTRYNIDTCSMLTEFNASVWTARKLDKSATEAVVSSNNAQAKDAARVNKHLLAGRSELETITKLVGRARTYVYDNTLPWSDSGLRLLVTQQLTSCVSVLSVLPVSVLMQLWLTFVRDWAITSSVCLTD